MAFGSVIADVAADDIAKRADRAVPLRRNVVSSKGRRENR
jgi:hypothetical protein